MPDRIGCPFLWETGRPAAERKPCPLRYRPSCGCKRTRPWVAVTRWRRSR